MKKRIADHRNLQTKHIWLRKDNREDFHFIQPIEFDDTPNPRVGGPVVTRVWFVGLKAIVALEG